jgi:amidase
MRIDEYLRYDAVGLAELVRQGQVTPSELLECAIELIERLNPKLNAVIDRCYERARQRINEGLPSGPFKGVPLLVKDDLDVAGLTMTLGSRFLLGHRPDHSHIVADRIEAAGFVLAGRTNMSELGLLPITEPVAYGPTKNPWNLEHSPGGSSGGSAAAVAARIVPLAQSSDGGGSTRIPASACGLVGLKPSRGRYPGMPEDDPDGFITRTCLSRTVRDSAAFMDAISGPRPGDRWWTPPLAEPHERVIERDPEPLRIAFTTTDFAGNVAHPECRAAVEKTARLCESLGHRVEEAAPPIDGRAYNEGFLVLWAMCAGYVFALIRQEIRGRAPERLGPVLGSRALFDIATRLAKPGSSLEAPFERFTHRLAIIDASHTPGDLWIAWRTMRQADRELTDFFEKHDVFLSPVLGEPPWKTGTFSHRWTDAELRRRLFAYVGYTHIANTSGLPALSLPLYMTADGLPIGTHMLAPWPREDRLLGLAAQLERADPWSQRTPGIGEGAS